SAGLLSADCLRPLHRRFRHLQLFAQLRLQTRPIRGVLFQSGLGVFQLLLPLAASFLEFFSPSFGFSRRLLHRRQLAADFLALFLQSAQLLFKSLAPFGFFPTGCLRFRSGRFRRLQLSAQLRFQARPFRPGSLGSAGALAQPLLQFFASPLGLSRRLLRRRQLAAEFLALLLLTAQFVRASCSALGYVPSAL